MALFMDYHEDLGLPAEAPAQIAEDTSHARANWVGVRQVELCPNPDGKVYCLLDGSDEDAIRQHHAALGVPCGEVHQVDSLTSPAIPPRYRIGHRATPPHTAPRTVTVGSRLTSGRLARH